MNTFDQNQDVCVQPDSSRSIRRNWGKWGSRFFFPLLVITVMLVARPQISSAGGSCSTTTGDCSGSITLHLG